MTRIDSLDATSQLCLSPNGSTVRITQRFIDPWSEEDDREVLVGDFSLEVLRARLADLNPTTGAAPLPQASRPGRRKPRYRWLR